MNVAVASCQRVARPLPRFTSDERERKHCGKYAAVPQLAMRQVHEIRGETGMAAAKPAARLLELALHRSLLVVRSIEACERRHWDVGMVGFVVRGPCERGIHDDKVAGCVLDRDGVLAPAVRCPAAQ